MTNRACNILSLDSGLNGWPGDALAGLRINCKHSTLAVQGEGPMPEGLIRAIEARMVAVEERQQQLLVELSKEEAGTPSEKVISINKELRAMEDVCTAIADFRKQTKVVEETETLLVEVEEDEELYRVARAELMAAQEEKQRLLGEVIQLLLPRDKADSGGCILEVRAGAGGDEAALFAMDIFRMYERYSDKRGWRFETLAATESQSGGYKEASASVHGDGAYGRLKFETGIHRVQRVPLTERGGRVHTSTASVAVLPEADEVDVKLRMEDVRIDTFRSGGAGGQSVNTTSSAVRVTHLRTGIVVAIQDERSQHSNKAKALKILRARLYENERNRQLASRSELRHEQIGSGDRSERIRTYNFAQARVTEHRAAVTVHSLQQVLDGEGLDAFIDALMLQEESRKLEELSLPHKHNK